MNFFRNIIYVKYMFRKLVLTSIVILFQSNFLLSQTSDLKFKHLKVRDGLSQSWITCIYQDSYGYMWFGTGGNGLNKYDGYEFEVYKNNPRKRNSLTNNFIHSIFEDSHKNLWIGTQFGLNIYDRGNDCFEEFPYLGTQYITGFYEAKDEILLVTTINNIYEINLKNKEVISYCDEPGGCLSDIFDDGIVEDENGNLWQGSSNGLYLIDRSDKTYAIFHNKINDPNSISDNVIMSISKDSKGRIWIGTANKGMNLMQFKDGKPSQPYFKNFKHNPQNNNSLSEGSIQAFLDDGRGNLWIGTENGGLDILDLTTLDQDEPHFNHYLNDIEDETSISYNSIYSLFQDDQGTIWIGTYGGGLNYYNELLFKFEHYVYRKSTSGNISNNTVNVIFSIEDMMLIGTEGGLNILNKGLNIYENLKIYDNAKLNLGTDAVWAIYEDSRNNLWIGTWAGGLTVYNSSSKKFIRYFKDSNNPVSISSNNIFGILEGRDGYLWVATMNGGLNRYDYKTNSFKSYRAKIAKENSISGDWVRTIFESSYNELWVSTSNGVDLFDREREVFINFTHDPDDSTSISYNGAVVLFEDSKRNIWLGTEGGLNLFIRADSSFVYYQEKDGLPDNSIKGICEDNHGNLWLSTNKGISKFVNAINRPGKPVFENFCITDGLQGDEFNRRAVFRDKNGYLYFGGTNGLNAFHPDSLKKNKYDPKIIFTDFLLFNKSVAINSKDNILKKHISVTEEITLSHKQSVITFQFAALSFLFPENNQYKYLMEGFDEHWNEVGTKREATYTNLDPGKYVFHVKGSNNDGVWNNVGIGLRITILPPWYKTILAVIIEIILSVSVLLGIYYYRINRLRAQKIKLEQLVDQRTLEIKTKNEILHKQTSELNEANVILEEKQQKIEEQNEMLLDKTEKLDDTNKLLEKRQEFIGKQAKKLIQTNDKLKTLNATKDKFFSIIAHDLKNPFNSILGFCEMILLRFDTMDNQKKKKLIQVIYDSSQNVYRLLENLLHWSRSQTGSIPFSPEEFAINELIDTNILLSENLINEKNLKVQNDLKKEILVFADKNMINTVIRNLLTNAIKFTENGSISIEINVDRAVAKISIADTGVGIANNKLDALFDIGGMKSTQGTKGETGTGLGLILCKEFIQKNGGTIHAKSEPGKGSTFVFTLPAR